MPVFKKKQLHKTAQQVAAELAHTAEISRLRNISKEKFYPFLLQQSTSVKDAQNTIQILDAIVKGKFNELMNTMKVSELKLDKAIKPTAPQGQQDKYLGIIDMFKDETLTTFIKVVSDFGSVINTLLQKRNLDLKLTDLDSPYGEDK